MKILIVDPVTLRRERLSRWLKEVPNVSVTAVGMLNEGYLAAEAHMPKVIALATDLASRTEFEGFYAVVAAIKADFVVYGDPKFLPSGAVCNPLKTDEDYSEMRARLTGYDLARQMQSNAPPKGIVLLGASTGGLSALESVLSVFPRDCPPTVIVQHMREGFMDSVIRRLDRDCAPNVRGVEGGERLQSGHVYVAADPGKHVVFAGRGNAITLQLDPSGPVSGHRPSVDMLFNSMADAQPSLPVAAALLTGMGADGAKGLLRLRQCGFRTIAQDQATSVVWGMPRTAVELGAAEQVLPIREVGDALLVSLSRRRASLQRGAS